MNMFDMFYKPTLLSHRGWEWTGQPEAGGAVGACCSDRDRRPREPEPRRWRWARGKERDKKYLGSSLGWCGSAD